MLSCQEGLIGIRGDCSAVVPTSGYYLEDLPGLTLQKIADSAEDRTGVTMMGDALDYAFAEIDREILNYSNERADSAASFEPYSLFYPNPGFTATTQPGAVNSKFEGVIRRTADFSFSKLRIETLFVKTLQAKAGVIFSIDDGVTVQVLPAVDLLADEVTEIPADIELASLEFTISADLTGVDVYVGNRYPAACTPCKTVRRHPYLNVTLAEGIECRILTQCDSDLVLCYVYGRREYLKAAAQAVRYQAGIYLLEQKRESTRANQGAQMFDINTLTAQIEDWKADIKEIVNQIMPNALHNIRRNDKFCYQCGGWMSSQYLT